MVCLEGLVLEYDKLDPVSGEAKNVLKKIEKWNGLRDEWKAALHITANNSRAAEVIKEKLESFAPLHHHIAGGTK